MSNPELAVMKCDPERALELRDQYSAIEGAFHWNKKFWNQIHFNSDCGDKLILELVNHSYQEVVKKLRTQGIWAMKDHNRRGRRPNFVS